MTEYSIPQQLTTTGDATRAPYDSDEWAFDHDASFSGYGTRANYGPVYGYDNGTNFGLEVTETSPVSTNVTLNVGCAIVRGTVYVNDAALTLAIAANVSGNPRIDTVILRKDYVAQTIRAVVKQGTPAATPSPPALTQSAGSTWEIPVADIAVSNGFASINQTNITPRHEWVNASHGVYLDGILNNSGITLQTGDVVVVDVTTDRAVTTTTIFNDSGVLGVWWGRTANGSRGRVLTEGIGMIRTFFGTTSAVTTIPAGTWLMTRATARYATNTRPFTALTVPSPGTPGNPSVIAHTLEDYSLDFLTVPSIDQIIPAYIRVRPTREIIRFAGTASADRGTFTSGAWTARIFNTSNSGSSYITLDGTGTQITLQPGRYRIVASAPAYRVDGHATRLQNITDGTTSLLGTMEYCPSAADSSQTRSMIQGSVFIDTATVFEFQHRCSTTRATDGLGNYVSLGGQTSTFEEITIERLGDYR